MGCATIGATTRNRSAEQCGLANCESCGIVGATSGPWHGQALPPTASHENVTGNVAEAVAQLQNALAPLPPFFSPLPHFFRKSPTGPILHCQPCHQAGLEEPRSKQSQCSHRWEDYGTQDTLCNRIGQRRKCKNKSVSDAPSMNRTWLQISLSSSAPARCAALLTCAFSM